MKLSEIAAHIDAELKGDPDSTASGLAALHRAGEGDISFLASPRYRKLLLSTQATAVIMSPEDYHPDLSIQCLLKTNPYAAYARVAQLLHPLPQVKPGCDRTAVIDASSVVDPMAQVGPLCVIGAGVQIAAGVIIGPGCIIGDGCHIGSASRLMGRVVLGENTRIGVRVMIQPGAVIGGDGFGFANDQGEWIKIPQLGGVLIGDDVEIGCNTTIDRGALDDTVIGDGVKLDNQIQIAHNVRIGAHTAIAACTGIAGSTTIGRRCAIGGSVGIVGHIEICDDVQLTGTTYVTHAIDSPGTYSSGVPMEPYQAWRRSYTRIKQLDDMSKRLRALEKKCNGSIDDGQQQ